jgi:hypothetical protein
MDHINNTGSVEISPSRLMNQTNKTEFASVRKENLHNGRPNPQPIVTRSTEHSL